MNTHQLKEILDEAFIDFTIDTVGKTLAEVLDEIEVEMLITSIKRHQK